jgi:hypothetical protein
LNGALVSLCPLPLSGWNIDKTFSCPVKKFNGIHKIYLVFKGDYGFCIILNSIVFKKAETTFIENLASSANQKVYFFPNPAKDYLNVHANENATIEIYTIQGQLLIKRQLSSHNNTIPVNDLPSEGYFIKISNKTKVFSDILIIK